MTGHVWGQRRNNPLRRTLAQTTTSLGLYGEAWDTQETWVWCMIYCLFKDAGRRQSGHLVSRKPKKPCQLGCSFLHSTTAAVKTFGSSAFSSTLDIVVMVLWEGLAPPKTRSMFAPAVSAPQFSKLYLSGCHVPQQQFVGDHDSVAHVG